MLNFGAGAIIDYNYKLCDFVVKTLKCCLNYDVDDITVNQLSVRVKQSEKPDKYFFLLTNKSEFCNFLFASSFLPTDGVIVEEMWSAGRRMWFKDGWRGVS